MFDPIRIDSACCHSLLLGSVCERKSTLFQDILLRVVVRYDGSRLIEGNVNTLAETGSFHFGAKAVYEGFLETCQLIVNYYLCSIG